MEKIVLKKTKQAYDKHEFERELKEILVEVNKTVNNVDTKLDKISNEFINNNKLLKKLNQDIENTHDSVNILSYVQNSEAKEMRKVRKSWFNRYKYIILLISATISFITALATGQISKFIDLILHVIQNI